MIDQNKVSAVEFHIKRNELDDCIVRCAELIKEGYRVEEIKQDKVYNSVCYVHSYDEEPFIHIKLERR